MSDEPLKTGPRRSRARMIVALLVLVLIGGYGAYRWILAARVQRQLDALAATGVPVTLEALDIAYERPPYEEDATDVLLMAMDEWRDLPQDLIEGTPIVGKGQPPNPWEPLPPMMLKILDQPLERNERTLRLTHKGAAMGRARWPMNLNDAFMMQLPHLAQLRTLARLLSVEALCASAHGDAERATRAVESITGLSHCLAEEPLLISQTVRIDVLGIGVKAAEQVMTRSELTDAQLARLEAVFADAEPSGATAVGMGGELCTIIGYMQTASDLSDANGLRVMPPLMGVLLYVPSGVRDMDILYALGKFQRVMEISTLPAEEKWAAAKAHNAQRERTPAHLFLSRHMMPAPGRALGAELRATAELRSARAAMAVQRYRLQHSALPESWEDIADHLPIDPFSGEANRYMRLEDGFKTYSVNQNEKDDGGTPWEDGDWRSADIVFQVGK
ncbi:MAG: hypothetical protein GY851_13705 [bacterium]|nr:hypothetical protein [bacterium]